MVKYIHSAHLMIYDMMISCHIILGLVGTVSLFYGVCFLHYVINVDIE